ncbi:hypothetical protein Pint_20252 [Pistacia integerrima]|uniref:Uncharacterized protein n=1 Tax=Pistacia integerrima TaxID=434235 RepID=A0ACC0XBX6_9ROSI|nr:hypothetical protein Pint_20252 [Pistacia integerrima]
MQSLRNLINSAVLDPGVKGGLRWPLGKSNLGDRYRVSGVWHTKIKLYESSSLRLKVKDADRFSFESSTGESTMEITLKLKGLASDILEQKVDTDTMLVMAARHERHSKHWERSSPAQRQLDLQFNRLSIESERPSSTRREFVPRYNRHSNDSERPSPAPNNRHFLWRSPRHDVQNIGVVMAARQGQQSKHWERSSPAQRQLDPQFNRLSIESEGPSSTRREFVPRNNRHSDDSARPSPPPNNRHFMWRSPRYDVQSTRSIVYPERAVFKCLATGLENDNHFPSSVCLKPISLEPKYGQNPSFVFVNSHLGKGKDEEGGNVSRRPWEYVAEKAWPDLLSCLENVRKKMKSQDLEEVNPKLVARMLMPDSDILNGLDVLDNGATNVSRLFDDVRKGQLSETTLEKLSKSFYTNFPTSYTEKIIMEAVPKIGVDFEGKKDIYHVRLSDSTQKDSIISCKCTLNNDKKLELYKASSLLLTFSTIKYFYADMDGDETTHEFSNQGHFVKLIYQLRHMVINISCLDKVVDLRLMLSGKRILTALTDNEWQRISNLIDSAVVDPAKKGGFRWPQTAYSQSSRYKVVGIWHTISEVYKSPWLLLEVKSANRYNFETATEDATREVSLKLKGIVSELLAQKRESDSSYSMFKDTLGMIWEHFLCCEQFLTTTDYIEEEGGQKYKEKLLPKKIYRVKVKREEDCLLNEDVNAKS